MMKHLSNQEKIEIYEAVEKANGEGVVALSIQECIDQGKTYDDILAALQVLQKDVTAAIAFVERRR